MPAPTYPSPIYEKVGTLTKLGQIKKSWCQRIFAVSLASRCALYFRSQEEFDSHCSTGAATQAGAISLANALMYITDYMEKPFCVEVAPRDHNNAPTRHYFIYAETGAELREWMDVFVRGGVTLVGPSFPMRVIPDSYKPSAPEAGRPTAPDPTLIAPLEQPVTLGKFGFMQKRGVYNKSFKARFFRIETLGLSGHPVLAYYETVYATSSKGSIPLTNLTFEDDETDTLCMKLTSAGTSRTFFLRAPSRGQKKRWIAVLTRISNGEKKATVDLLEPIIAKSSDATPAPADSPAAAAASLTPAASSSDAVPSPSPVEPVEETPASPTPVVEAKKPRRPLKASAFSGSSRSTSRADEEASMSFVIRQAEPEPEPVAEPAEPLADPTPTPEEPNSAPTETPVETPVETRPSLPVVTAEPTQASRRESSVSAVSPIAYPSEEDQEKAQVSAALTHVQQGTFVFKIPTSSLGSVERKRFYLLPVVGSTKASELLAEARKEMKQKSSKKQAYYDSIQSGYILHWDSSKPFAYETFIWLSPDAPRSEWTLQYGQRAGMFIKRKLKENITALASQSLTITTPKRSFDLAIENRKEFAQWRTALSGLDAQRPR